MPDLSHLVSQLRVERNRVHDELGRLDKAINALRGSTTSNGSGKTRVVSAKPRRTMSVSARRKIAAAQKARWAAWRTKQKKAA
jgi:hypothetical protein